MSPHVRYDILLANLYFKNIHQSEDFQERRPRHELGKCGSGCRGARSGGGEVGGRRGRLGEEGRGGEAHPSFPSSPGWRDSCGPPEEEEEEEEGLASAAHQHQSQRARGEGQAKRRGRAVVTLQAAGSPSSSSNSWSWNQNPPQCRRPAAALPQSWPRPTKAPPPEANLILSPHPVTEATEATQIWAETQ